MEPESQISKNYIVGSGQRFLVFEIELQNNGNEPSLENFVKIESLNKLPSPRGTDISDPKVCFSP